ncbi:hypothetical protein DPX16_4018 [Anabarilius grahami]|uniref:Uncharacterized protein n=1 Tax=Anabarilius grahami TaxID=495550 RepID=A0A3N0Y0R7_ANAGA|nr:hypothetical protein DPX16_4018 [Anabarilius grahami]
MTCKYSSASTWLSSQVAVLHLNADTLQTRRRRSGGAKRESERLCPHPKKTGQRDIFKECTSSNIARRKFLLRLAEELKAEFMEGKRAASQLTQGPNQKQNQPPQLTPKRRQCQVRRICKQNKTHDTCCKCHKPVCGNCARRTEVTCVDCES